MLLSRRSSLTSSKPISLRRGARIEKVFAEGDYVILHVHSIRPANIRGRAIIEIFRLENGKIDEHWDVIQEIPETSANPNGMF